MSFTQCPKCGYENAKIREQCKKCSTQLYAETEASTAKRLTIILDIVSAALYIICLPLFVGMAERMQDVVGNDMLLADFPYPQSLSYYFVLFILSAFALIKIAFVVSVFIKKSNIILPVRKVLMYLEIPSLFQLILLLYFYRPALAAIELEKK